MPLYLVLNRLHIQKVDKQHPVVEYGTFLKEDLADFCRLKGSDRSRRK